MEKRINVEQLAPKSYKAMLGLSASIAQSQVSKSDQELIKIRASQINGCAFCLNMHTQDALRLGETNQRIFMLNAWKETELFTPKERVILAMTEEITLISRSGLSHTTYQEAIDLLGEEYTAEVIFVIITINAWNRIAIATNKPI